MPRVLEIKELAILQGISKNADESFFSTDLTIHGSQGTVSKIVITGSLSANNPNIEFSYNGMTWSKLNSSNVAANELFVYEIYCPTSESINFRSSKSTTVNFFCVGEAEYA